MLQVAMQSSRKKNPTLHPRIKVWLSSEDAEGVFGDGKWRLLSAVDRLGSLKAAAEKMGMSYRKAWGDLKKAEEHLGYRLIVKQRGGAEGGRTTLTEEGRKWVSCYRDFRKRIEEVVQEAFDQTDWENNSERKGEND